MKNIFTREEKGTLKGCIADFESTSYVVKLKDGYFSVFDKILLTSDLGSTSLGACKS